MILLTQAEFGERHGVKPPAVSAWKRKGLLVFAADPARGGKLFVDAEKSDLLVRGTIDQTRGRPTAASVAAVETGQPSAPSPSVHRPSLKDDYEAERILSRRIENQQKLGNLVQLSEYERRAGDMGRLVRERTGGIIRQVAERLAAESDPRVVISVLSDAFDILFTQMADEIEAAASEERAADAALEVAAQAEAMDDEDEAEEAAA